jgi:hypothetical protein
MKQSYLMIILTCIIIGIAVFGKYTDGEIHKSATTILEDRLKPAPLLSHRFDYYGTNIEGALTSELANIDTLLAHKDDIMESRERTGKEWQSYLATYLVRDEDSVAKLVNTQMVELDKKLDNIFLIAQTDKEKAQKTLEESRIKDELPSITDRINWLTDLQTRVGADETNKMLHLISIFDNFMIGALALAIMLVGSIIYSAIRDKRGQSVTKKTTTKKVLKGKPKTKKK